MHGYKIINNYDTTILGNNTACTSTNHIATCTSYKVYKTAILGLTRGYSWDSSNLFLLSDYYVGLY